MVAYGYTDNTVPVASGGGAVTSVDGQTGDVDLSASYVDVAGDTMTGPLTLSGDPSAALQPATKQYVDNAVAAVSGGGGGGTPSDTVTAETSYGASSSAGVADTYSRGDHTHGSPSLSSSAASSSAVGDSATVGSGTTAARADHVHGRESFGAVTAQTSFGASSANGSATSPARSDHTHGTPVHDGAAHNSIKTSDLANIGFYNVKDYGVTGDGSTDDAANIQTVLDLAAVTNPGSTVYFPNGTYKVNSELEIKGSIVIRATRGATIKRGSNSMQYLIKNFNSSYAPTLYSGRGDILIEGGTWDGDGGNLTGSVTVMVFAHAKNVTVKDATIRNVRDWHGIEFNSTKDGVAQNCVFEGFTPVASNRQISEAVQIDLAIDSGALPGIGSGAYDNTPCDGIRVDGCTVRSYGSLGSFGRLCGSHSYTDNVFHKKIRIIGNHAESLNDFMVRGYNWIDATVTGNTCTDSNGGVRFEIPSGATVESESINISANTFRNMGVQNNGASVVSAVISIAGLTTPSSVPARECAINGNIIKTYANVAAIEVINTADAVTTGNVVKNGTASGAKGIDSVSSANAVISGNKIDTVTYGVHIRDVDSVSGAGTTITGNHFSACSTNAALIESDATAFVANKVRTCGAASGFAVVINAPWCIYQGNHTWRGSASSTSQALSTTANAEGLFIAANYFRGYGTTNTRANAMTNSIADGSGDTDTGYSSTEKYVSTSNNS